MEISVLWLRRDLRLEDNIALNEALLAELPTLILFIFDENILNKLPQNDARVSFIYDALASVNHELNKYGSSVLCLKGDPVSIWKQLIKTFSVKKVFFNRDYEPYAINRDNTIKQFLKEKNIQVRTFKDQVIFEQDDVTKDDGKPYTVFTPYKNKWLSKFYTIQIQNDNCAKFKNLYPGVFLFPSLLDIGFHRSGIKVCMFDFSCIPKYSETRNFPASNTSFLGPHLRFGTISIRKLIHQLNSKNEIFLSELIWREFFMQILYHFPKVENHNFKSQYDGINWRNDEKEFERWSHGQTGYPLVDAGMRQLNATGYIHNRVRMVAASFLCKHLLIDWRWGEAYFAMKLLDFELSSNNGNWQWAAGTGCDAAPYFRIFNPTEQLRKFDPDLSYIKKWIPEYGKATYPAPMVEHSQARIRTLTAYKEGLQNI